MSQGGGGGGYSGGGGGGVCSGGGGGGCWAGGGDGRAELRKRGFKPGEPYRFTTYSKNCLHVRYDTTGEMAQRAVAAGEVEVCTEGGDGRVTITFSAQHSGDQGPARAPIRVKRGWIHRIFCP